MILALTTGQWSGSLTPMSKNSGALAPRANSSIPLKIPPLCPKNKHKPAIRTKNVKQWVKISYVFKGLAGEKVVDE